MLYRENFKKIFTTYKGLLVFFLPPILLAIVGSVVTRNKPDLMKPALVASALACITIIGFVTNVFIDLGLQYIELKKEDWGNKQKYIKETTQLIIWSIIMALFNFLYLLFITWIYTDVTGFIANNFFTGDTSYLRYSIDWAGVILSIFLATICSIAMMLFFANIVRDAKVFMIIGGLYFLAYGYMAGGMFGPGATHWMFVFSLILPHAYLAHFMGGAFTGGHYVAAHSPSLYDFLTTDYLTNMGAVNFDINSPSQTIVVNKPLAIYDVFTGNNVSAQDQGIFFREAYIAEGSSIWDMSVWNPGAWIQPANGIATGVQNTYSFKVEIDFSVLGHDLPALAFHTSAKLYNPYYQINAANIFVPLTASILFFVAWLVMFENDLKAEDFLVDKVIKKVHNKINKK